MSIEQVAYPVLEDIERRLRSGAIAALSTDVFDTIVWRTVPEPTDLFLLLGQALRDRRALDSSLDPRSFAMVRRRGEVAARKELLAETGSTEVRLEEIWRRIPEWCHRPLSRDEALGLEIEFERKILVPDLDVVDLLRVATEAGVPVYAVSDTYFSPEQLRALFAQPFLSDLRFERIFTSSDRRTGKGGTLFDHVVAAADCPAEQITHIGDNSDVDVVPAEERRIGTAHLMRRTERLEYLLRRESSYRRVRGLAPKHSDDAARADLADLDGSLVQLRAKVALQREAHSAPRSLRPMWQYGAEVLGAPFAGFADWVVEQARRSGARRLHCLMREGAFLAELIDQAAAAAGADLTTTRFFLNRQVATVAAICDASRQEIAAVLVRRDEPTVRELLGILGVDPAIVPELAGHLESRLDDGVRREQTLDALAANDSARAQVQHTARTLRERIVRMVREQHGDSDEPFVLVDLGWGASIQRRLAQLLRQAGVDLRVDGLYLVTHAGAVETVTLGGRVSGFLSNLGYPRTVAEVVVRSPEVLEQVFMPDTGTQLGLSEELEPILADVSLPATQRAEAAAVRDGVRAFQRTYLRYRTALPTKVRSLGEAADQLTPIVVRSCVDPTAEEAARFGAWRHDSGEGTDHVERLASDRLAGHVSHLHPRQLRGMPTNDVYWPPALARLRDPCLADLAAAQASGLVSPEAGAAEVETGEMRIEASAGIALEESTMLEMTPRRNHRGLSFVCATLWGGHIERVQIRLGTHPALFRIDNLSLRIHLRDRSEPLSVRLDSPEHAHAIEVLNILRLSDRVLAGTDDYSYLSFPIARATPLRPVYRVDVEFSFMALAWDAQTAPPTGLGDADAQRRLEEVLQSASWRLTRPLRAAKRLLGRGG